MTRVTSNTYFWQVRPYLNLLMLPSTSATRFYSTRPRWHACDVLSQQLRKRRQFRVVYPQAPKPSSGPDINLPTHLLCYTVICGSLHLRRPLLHLPENLSTGIIHHLKNRCIRWYNTVWRRYHAVPYMPKSEHAPVNTSVSNIFESNNIYQSETKIKAN